jgi:hypothetical protein
MFQTATSSFFLSFYLTFYLTFFLSDLQAWDRRGTVNRSCHWCDFELWLMITNTDCDDGCWWEVIHIAFTIPQWCSRSPKIFPASWADEMSLLLYWVRRMMHSCGTMKKWLQMINRWAEDESNEIFLLRPERRKSKHQSNTPWSIIMMICEICFQKWSKEKRVEAYEMGSTTSMLSDLSYSEPSFTHSSESNDGHGWIWFECTVRFTSKTDANEIIDKVINIHSRIM